MRVRRHLTQLCVVAGVLAVVQGVTPLSAAVADEVPSGIVELTELTRIAVSGAMLSADASPEGLNAKGEACPRPEEPCW